jgi:hypothetical protein
MLQEWAMPTASVLLSIPLAVPLAVLLGALAAGAGARLRFVRGGPTFRCKERSADTAEALARRWPRGRGRARWVHDVLLVQRGILRPRTEAWPVSGPDRPIRQTFRVEVAGLGAAPVVLTLRLDDGRTIQVAAREADRTALAGPFLAAVIPSLPRAPTEPRRRFS